MCKNGLILHSVPEASHGGASSTDWAAAYRLMLQEATDQMAAFCAERWVMGLITIYSFYIAPFSHVTSLSYKIWSGRFVLWLGSDIFSCEDLSFWQYKHWPEVNPVLKRLVLHGACRKKDLNLCVHFRNQSMYTLSAHHYDNMFELPASLAAWCGELTPHWACLPGPLRNKQSSCRVTETQGPSHSCHDGPVIWTAVYNPWHSGSLVCQDCEGDIQR